jgi:hypothetical protein
MACQRSLITHEMVLSNPKIIFQFKLYDVVMNKCYVHEGIIQYTLQDHVGFCLLVMLLSHVFYLCMVT